MTAKKLRASIREMSEDMEFSYNGVDGSICPFEENNIGIMYDGKEETVHSVDELMTKPFIDGHSLEEVCSKLRFY